MMGNQGTNDDEYVKNDDDLISDILKTIEFHKSGLSDTRVELSQLSDSGKKIATLFNNVLDLYQGNLTLVESSIHKIQKGDFETDVPALPGKLTSISESIDNLRLSLLMMEKDISRFSTACSNGDLTLRVDSAKYKGGFAEVIESMDKGIEAISFPVKVLSGAVADFAEGKLPDMNDESQFQGEFKKIIQNLNTITKIMKLRGEDLNALIRSAEEGILDARADPTKYPGYNGNMFIGLNKILDAYISPINVSAEYIDRISKGDIPPKITEDYRGDFNEIKNNLNALIDVVHMRNDDIRMLIDAAIDGKLDVRADHVKYPGENGKMIKGINDMLDSYIGPINVSAEYIDRISKGDTPPKISEEYKGDFNEIKNNLNTLIDVIQLRGEDILMLTQAGMEGKLDVRADPSKYSGYHGGMIQNINKMLDIYISPLNLAAEYIDRISKGDLPPKITEDYHGDFNELKNNLNQCIEAISLLEEDVMMLAKSAQAGTLHVRADISRQQGSYALLIEGINKTLDAFVEPIEEAMRVSSEYAKCNLSTSFNPSIVVQGEFAEFRDSLNVIGVDISKTIKILLEEIKSLSKHASTAHYGVEDVSRGAKEIAQNADETSTNASKAEDGIDQVLHAMADLTVMVSEISVNADSVARLSEDANILAKKGTEHAGEADKGMVSITRSSSEVEQIIGAIRNEMDQIRKIVNIITDLANQTNLLALNAAIEAARAGEAGRGFAVVASEVKALAQESRASAESITDMIMGLERKSDDAAHAIEAAGKAVKEGNGALSDTLNVFTELTSAVDTINQKMLTIAQATEQQAASFEEITASANEMSSLVKKTADDATQSSATSEEALAVVSQINEIIDLINAAVGNMQREIELFTLQE